MIITEGAEAELGRTGAVGGGGGVADVSRLLPLALPPPRCFLLRDSAADRSSCDGTLPSARRCLAARCNARQPRQARQQVSSVRSSAGRTYSKANDGSFLMT